MQFIFRSIKLASGHALEEQNIGTHPSLYRRLKKGLPCLSYSMHPIECFDRARVRRRLRGTLFKKKTEVSTGFLLNFITISHSLVFSSLFDRLTWLRGTLFKNKTEDHVWSVLS